MPKYTFVDGTVRVAERGNKRTFKKEKRTTETVVLILTSTVTNKTFRPAKDEQGESTK
jgi:hypothetical protein